MLKIQTSFNAGELSPKLGGRVDIDRYEIGCQTLQNFFVHPHGGATRRSGFEYIAAAKNSDKEVRIIPFEFNVEQAYILEIGEADDGDGYIRFYKDGGVILDGADPYELKGADDNIPWDDTELFEISFAQSADTMYFCHPNWPPRKLTRTGHTSWTMEVIILGPTIDPPTSMVTLTPVGGTSFQFRYHITAVANDTFEESVPLNETFVIGYASQAASCRVSLCKEVLSSGTAWTATQVASGVCSCADTTGLSNGDVVYFNNGTNAGRMSEITAVSANVSFTVQTTEMGISDVTESITVYKCTPHGLANANRIFIDDIEGMTELNGREYLLANKDNAFVELKDSFDSAYINSTAYEAYTGGGEASKVFFTLGGLTSMASVSGLGHGWNGSGYTSVYIKLEWSAVDDVSHYNIYRSTTGTPSFLAQSKVPWFLDRGEYEPNQGDTAPVAKNPFSEADDYPSCVTFYEERLMFSSPNNNPQTIWGSQTANYENMNVSYPLKDDDSVEYTLSTDRVNIIRWMYSGKKLFIGTSGGEFWMDGGAASKPITPTDVQVKRESSRGSENIAPIGVGDSILFVERGGKKLRDFSQSNESYDTYDAKDLTIFSDHLTEEYGITGMAYQQTPDSVVWCVRSDGVLLGLTFVKEHKVLAWHRHVTDGEVESVAVIPGDTHRELWAVVKRTIDGSDLRYIERLATTFSGTTTEDATFVDSWLTYNDPLDIEGISKADPAVVDITGHDYSDGDKIYLSGIVGMTDLNGSDYLVANKTADTFEITDTDGNDIDSTGYDAWSSGGTSEKYVGTISGLDHLEGKTVQVLGDGAVCTAAAVVTSGSITLENSVTVRKAHVGLQYISNLKTMAIESDAQGTIQGTMKRIHSLTVRLHKTVLGEYGPDEDTLSDIPWDAADYLGDAPALFTGDKKLPFPGKHDLNGQVYIRQDLPLPMSILSVIPELEV